jgi:FkbM family methyltransferase
MMKTSLVGTRVGRLALAARGAVELLRATYLSLESIGTVANDHLATRLVTRLCLPGKGFIDVGAHVGSITSAVIDHDPSIKIYAIEPMAEKASHLRRRFPTVEVHQCALGDSHAEVPFFVNPVQSGYSSLRRLAAGGDAIATTVSLRKLDALISSNDIDVIKIDVEGAELGVLRGGNDLIAKNRPVVMFESGALLDDEASGAAESIWLWLQDRDFDIAVPNRVAHNGPGMSLDGFLDAHLYPRRTTNYFAIPRERRVEIRERARAILRIATA